MTEPIAWFAHLEKKNMNFKIFSFTNVRFRITQKHHFKKGQEYKLSKNGMLWYVFDHDYQVEF